MNGEFTSGTRVEAEEMLVLSGNETGYTIDFIGDDEVNFEVVVVWGDEALRNRIVELLNRYGVKD